MCLVLSWGDDHRTVVTLTITTASLAHCFHRKVPDAQCCSGPRAVLSLVLNLIPSKSDQSLLPNWAICTWVVTNKKQSVALFLLSFNYHPHLETQILTSFVVCLHPVCLPTMHKNSGNRGSLRVCC